MTMKKTAFLVLKTGLRSFTMYPRLNTSKSKIVFEVSLPLFLMPGWKTQDLICITGTPSV